MKTREQIKIDNYKIKISGLTSILSICNLAKDIQSSKNESTNEINTIITNINKELHSEESYVTVNWGKIKGWFIKTGLAILATAIEEILRQLIQNKVIDKPQ